MIPQRVSSSSARSRVTLSKSESDSELKAFAPVGIESGSTAISVHIFIYCALFVIGLLVFWPGLPAQYFADDFQWYFGAAPHHMLEFFLAKNALVAYAYRPIEACFLLLVQRLWGLNTIPIHVVQIALHSLMCWLVFVWMRQLKFDWWQSLIGCGYMLISQANVHAVVSNDTFSQISGTLSGYFSLWFLFMSLRTEHRHHTTQVTLRFLSVAAFIWALLSKETTTSFLLMAAAIALIEWHARSDSWLRAAKRAALTMIPYVAVVFAYFVLRASLQLQGAKFGHGRYDLWLGVNVPRNLGLFLVQAFLPTSSSSTFVAFGTGDKLGWCLPLIAALLIALLTGYGWLRLQRWRTLLVLSLIGLLGLVPAILINKVSELYLYNSMPVIAAVVGAAFGALTKRNLRPRIRVTAATLLICLCATNFWALRGKTIQMRDNGERATILMDQISTYFAEIPTDGRLVLVNTKPKVPEYSVFSINGFNVLEGGCHRLNELAARSDFDVAIVDASRMPALDPAKDVVLSLDPASGLVARLNEPHHFD